MTATEHLAEVKIGAGRGPTLGKPTHLAVALDSLKSATPEACVTWPGSCNTYGYGHAARRGLAHRVIWEIFCGPVPEGYELDHLCSNRPCVNLLHLEVVTHAENNRRRIIREFGYDPDLTCRRGHPRNDANTHWERSNGCPSCRVCKRDALRAKYIPASARGAS